MSYIMHLLTDIGKLPTNTRPSWSSTTVCNWLGRLMWSMHHIEYVVIGTILMEVQSLQSLLVVFYLYFFLSAPSIFAQISESTGEIVGESFNLICRIFGPGAENIISTCPSLISGLKTPVVDRHKLEPTPALSPSLQFNCLMLLIIPVQLWLLQTTSQVASLQYHLGRWQFKVS